MSAKNQTTDAEQNGGDSGTKTTGLTPRNSDASSIPNHNPSGENAEKGNRNKKV